MDKSENNSIYGRSVVVSMNEEKRQQLNIDAIINTCRRLEHLINQQAIEINNMQRKLIELGTTEGKVTVGDVIKKTFPSCICVEDARRAEMAIYHNGITKADYIMRVPFIVWNREVKELCDERETN